MRPIFRDLAAGILLGLGLAATASISPAQAGEYNITVDPVTIDTGAFTREGVGFNGGSPGPVLRFLDLLGGAAGP